MDNPFGGPALVDQQLGNSYQVVKDVRAALPQILYLASNMDLITAREIQLRESPDFQYLQWRHAGDLNWTNLISIQDLAKGLIIPPGTTFGIPEPTGPGAFARKIGQWVQALSTDLVGQAGGIASLGSDGKVPAAQLPTIPTQTQADWTVVDSSNPAYIKDKPTLFSGAYADLSGKPSLFSGAYADLSGKPTIPQALSAGTNITISPQGVISSTAQGGTNYNLPAATRTTLGGVIPGTNVSITADGTISVPAGFSGAYADLSGKPTLFSGAYADLSGKPSLFSGAYADLSGKPTIPAVQVQSDWNVTDNTSLAFIKNKPTSTGSSTAGGFTPTAIADGSTFNVPADFQALFVMPITVDGILQADGYLIEV